MKQVVMRDGSTLDAFEHAMSLVIVNLRGSVPASWVSDFRQTLGRYAGFSLDQRAQLKDIFQELSERSSSDSRSASMADVVTLGDAWLAAAVQAGRVQSIAGAQHSRWWRQLSPRWRQLVTRDAQGRPDSHGNIYAAPYRWGATLVAYSQVLTQRGGRPITDWSDLLQPQLTGKIAFLDSSRELVGIALKTLGLAYNTTARELQHALGPDAEARLADRVQQLRQQAKLFSNRDHIRALETGDVLALVGSSQDVIGVGERSQQLQVVCPSSGTALWADLWSVPSGARGGHQQVGPSPILPAWIEFGLQPARISTLPGLKTGASPLLLPDAAPATSAQLTSHDIAWDHAAKNAAGPSSPKERALEKARNVMHAVQHRLSHLQDGHTGSSSSSADSHSTSTSTRGADSEPPARGAEKQADVKRAAALHHVRLSSANSYLPPTPVLARSEFLLPLDDDTLQMYRRVLDGLTRSDG